MTRHTFGSLEGEAPSRRGLLVGVGALLASGWASPAWAEVEVWDISYGVGPNLDALKAAHKVVAGHLGEGVARKLVVVQLADARYALVYRRGGDLAGTRSAASRHASLLGRHGLDATAIARKGRVVFPGPVAEARPTPNVAARAATPSSAPAPPELSQAIDAYVKGLRKAGRVTADEQTSWLVYDLANDRLLASINGEVSRQAASMIKPLVMLAFFHEVERGRFIYGPVSRGRMETMIQRSSNVSTNWAIDQLGGPAAVHRLLQTHYGQLVPRTRIVERIGPGGRTYRNSASVGDYGRYLRALWRGDLPYSKEQGRILGLPKRDRIYRGAPSIPKGTLVLDKTGSTSRCCGDMGILVARRAQGGRFPYVFCGVIEKGSRASRYGAWISSRGDVIRGVSDLTYRHLRPIFGLA